MDGYSVPLSEWEFLWNSIWNNNWIIVKQCLNLLCQSDWFGLLLYLIEWSLVFTLFTSGESVHLQNKRGVLVIAGHTLKEAVILEVTVSSTRFAQSSQTLCFPWPANTFFEPLQPLQTTFPPKPLRKVRSVGCTLTAMMSSICKVELECWMNQENKPLEREHTADETSFGLAVLNPDRGLSGWTSILWTTR